MCFKNKVFSKVYALVVVFFGLALLAGCSGDNDKPTTGSSASSSSHINSSASSNLSQSKSSQSSVSSSTSSLLISSYVGHWYAPAYGYVLSVSVEGDLFTVKTYSVTKDYCLLQNVVANLSLNKFEQDYSFSPPVTDRLLENNGVYPPDVEYEKVEHLPVICEENLQKVKMDDGYVFDAKRDFEIFWQTLSELYINFELREINWDDAYQEASKSIDGIKNEDELFEFLSALITPLGDGHAGLLKTPLGKNVDDSIAAAIKNNDAQFFGASTQLSVSQKLVNEYVRALESEGEFSGELTNEQIAAADEYYFTNYLQIIAIISSYAAETSEVKTRANGEIAWFKTNDNIGYLIIGSMSAYTEGSLPLASDVVSDLAIAETAISEALRDLVDTKGIIVDVRLNEGGEDQVALNFVRHFIDKPQFVYSKFAGKGNSKTALQEVVLDPQSDNIYLKPTAVLVGGDTASAAELFTIAMASLPQVTIIGEPTAGEFSDVLVKRLTSDILFGVSNETYLDVQGNNYERIGIPADIVVPFATPQERKGGYDSGIDKAIEWIKKE